jgi:microcystin-dependent protein
MPDRPFVGEVRAFTFGVVPEGWVVCDGRSLAINAYPALFRAIGYTYGGVEQATFNIPDLRGRVAIGAGEGEGLTRRERGDDGGETEITLSTAQMPNHDHRMQVSNDIATSREPGHNVFAVGDGVRMYQEAGRAEATPMHAGMVRVNGGGQPHTNLQPFVALSYCIATVGIPPEGEDPNG